MTWLALVSNSKVQDYFEYASLSLPTMSKLKRPTLNALIAQRQSYMEARRNRWGLIGLAIIATFALASYWNSSSTIASVADSLIFLALTALILIIFNQSPNRRWQEVAAWRLFVIIRAVEGNAQHWNTIELKNQVTYGIEQAAKAVERIPLQFTNLSPDIKREIVVMSIKKAQAIRNLQHWVVSPGPLTFADLLHRLSCDLELVVGGRWYELPESDYRPRKRRWPGALWPIIGAALFIAAIVLIGYASRQGIPTLAIPVLITAASGIFSRLGYSVEMIQGSIDTDLKMSRK
jgi:hypothetical protein